MRPSAQAVRFLFDYDRATGILRWRHAPSPRVKVGDIAGRLSSTGYIHVGIDGKRYLAHMIIWLWVTGDWPVGEIDHKNRQRSDNRWDNLRDTTHSVNMKNTPIQKRNKTGYKGVFQNRHGTFTAYVDNNKIRTYLGNHATAEAAHLARQRHLS